MLRLGVDVGGTFTDFALYDEQHHTVRVLKCLTTPDDPARAVLSGLQTLLQSPQQLAAVTHLVHATTLATNVVLERKGEGVALLTTRGFRDVLAIRRQKRYELYDLFIDTPQPLVPRWHIGEVTERLRHDGSVLTPLDEAEVRSALRTFVDHGVQSLAICLLHAYANPAHERRIAELAARLAPHLLVSLSSEVCPQFREYERTSTTVANAYVMPRVHAYLGTLAAELRQRGLRQPLYVMQSNGGIATAEVMRRYPVRMIESGPAAGVTMTAFLGRHLGLTELMSFDMGGTTAKVCLIEGGTPAVTREFEVDRVRMKSGSGLPLSVPSVDLNEIGAGGGSIARLAMGIISVGPDSAGASPGPLCYGLGGTAPTVTDANLLLGYLNPEYFLGGSMRLDVAAARQGIAEQIAQPLGLDVVRAAWGIHQTVNASMARAARMVSIERGKDPRRFTLVAFGGAGPLHSSRMARDLGVAQMIVPAAAGVASALGLLAADVAFDVVRTFVLAVHDRNVAAAQEIFVALEAAGAQMVHEASPDSACTLTRTVEMRYVGQGHELEVAVPAWAVDAALFAEVQQRFHRLYAATYGYSDTQEAMEIVHWKVIASAPATPLVLPTLATAGADPTLAVKGVRPAYFPETQGFVACPVYDRYRLTPGMTLSGPALIEERESTVVLLPGDSAQVDALGNVLITLPQAALMGEAT